MSDDLNNTPDNLNNTPMWVFVMLPAVYVVVALATLHIMHHYNSVWGGHFCAFLCAFVLGSRVGLFCSPLLLAAAREAFGALEVTPDLAGMKASWGTQPRVYALIIVYIVWGLCMEAILGVAVWLSVFHLSTPTIAGALGVSAVWAGWRWLTVLAEMQKLAQSITIEATFDRITVIRERKVFRAETEIPADALVVTTDDHQLTLSGPEASLTLPCEQTPARDQLVSTLQEMSARAAASPFEHPPLPEALAALRGAPEGH